MRSRNLATALLVETMVTDGVAELLIGVTRDQKFGLLMTIAAGGVLVELLERFRIAAPAGDRRMRFALQSFR